MKCPDCNKKVLSKQLEHCIYCGLIFNTYKPIKKSHNVSVYNGKSCFGCKTRDNLSKHHVVPKRLKLKSKKKVILCKSCHSKHYTT